jgi:tail-anchored protein insertion receptor
VIQFWYAKAAVFWIPEGWLPGYVEWILAFPRAPRGSVSVQIWLAACGAVIQMLVEAGTATYILATKKAADQKTGRPDAQAFAVNGQKKEL